MSTLLGFISGLYVGGAYATGTLIDNPKLRDENLVYLAFYSKNRCLCKPHHEFNCDAVGVVLKVYFDNDVSL